MKRRAMKSLVWVFMTTVLVGALLIGSWPERSRPSTAAERIERISTQLRCPTCQGLSVADSDSPLSRSSREEIARQVSEGRSDVEIRSFFVERYGPDALSTPSGNGFRALAYGLPLAGALVLLLVLALATRRRRYSRAAAAPTAADRTLVLRALTNRANGP